MLILLLVLFALSSATCPGFKCSSCVKCLSSFNLPDGSGIQVTLGFLECKGSAVSWACIRSNTIGQPTCNAQVESTPVGYICNGATNMTAVLPPGSTSVKVQVHDGQNSGNFDCGGSGHPNCCGGASQSSCSGVCQIEVPLCFQRCTSDYQCSKLTNTRTCTVGKCNLATYTCYEAPATRGTVCDPKDPYKPCDADDYCDGYSKTCPETVKPNTTICKYKDPYKPCDANDYCDGYSKNCPDAVEPKTTICKEKDPYKPCDADDYCDGYSKTCPDKVQKEGTPCRPADGSCDKPDYCDGHTKTCVDNIKPEGTICRDSTGPCDPADRCDGTTKTCTDVRFAIETFKKCGQNYDYCGPIDVTSPTFLTDVGFVDTPGNNYALKCPGGTKTISIGSASGIFTQLPYPACLSQCISPTCTNGKDISNFVSAICYAPQTKFVIDFKYESINFNTETAKKETCSGTTQNVPVPNLC